MKRGKVSQSHRGYFYCLAHTKKSKNFSISFDYFVWLLCLINIYVNQNYVYHLKSCIIKQSNQTKLKISLISLCGLNIERFPCELAKPSPFSYFQIFSPLFDSIWIRNDALNGTWAALTTILKSTFLPNFVFVGPHGNPLPEVK